MKNKLNKTIKDYQSYLGGIAILSKHLDEVQKEQLNTILEVQLSLLVALKRDSNLGKYSINWE